MGQGVAEFPFGDSVTKAKVQKSCHKGKQAVFKTEKCRKSSQTQRMKLLGQGGHILHFGLQRTNKEKSPNTLPLYFSQGGRMHS